jgi:uncharacterized membrane protein YdcZ (DUF606 family)
MATDSRTLKLAILGEVKDLSASLNKGSAEVQTFGDKISKFGKVAGAAFLAAGVAAVAYAGKLAVDGVKAAIEDEAAQLRLAASLKNVTGATDAQIAATEDYILKTSLANGVTDEELRPSLDRLVRSTKDVAEAQKLQSLALDIAAATGKSLTQVSESLAKAHDGNFGSLKRLGVSIDENIIKSKDFDAATAVLASTFKDQASIQADTFNGKMNRLKVAFDEGKETVGGFILDAITPMVSLFVDKAIPAISEFAGNLKENVMPILMSIWEFAKGFFTPIIQGIKEAFGNVSEAVSRNSEEFNKFFGFVKAVYDFLKTYVYPFIGKILGAEFKILGLAISALIDFFASLVNIIDKAYKGLVAFVNFIKNNPVTQGIAGVFGGGRAAGGPVSAGTTYLVGENGPELFTSSTSGTIIPNGSMGGNTVNITVNGAIDPISTARQIANILNREATISGSFNRVGSSLLVGA